MIALVLVTVGVVVVAAIVALRSRVAATAATERARAAEAAREEAMLTVAAEESARRAAERARDDALEREQRGRRDATDVATRLREVSDERDRLRGELESERQRVAKPTSSSAKELSVLWDLSLRRVRRTWSTSLSLGMEESSPLDDADDPLRAAVRIEIEAAHEEIGADIEVEWADDTTADPQTALLILGVVQDVIGDLGKSAAHVAVTIGSNGEAVDVRVEASDEDGVSIPVIEPAALAVEPGLFRVGADVGSPAPRGAPLGRSGSG